jgi:dTDP-4-amino-4,6-dideoxygalactose transaminase
LKVPFLDLQAQYQSLKEEFDSGIDSVLSTSAYIQGPQVRRFEEEFEAYLGVTHAVGVANGTDALYLSLRACGIGPGDEVITAANTFMATTEAISATGAAVVLVDCDPASYTIQPASIEKSITDRTRAIIPVHLYGQPSDMAPIMEIARKHKLRVIEDACQAHGARYQGARVGTLGDIGCFSCYPGKNLGAFGDAGIIVTNDDALNDRVRLLANHGSRTRSKAGTAGSIRFRRLSSP